MSQDPNQDYYSGSMPEIDSFDRKAPDQDLNIEVELDNKLGQEAPLDYADTSVEELVEKWKQRSEERDCQYASIGLHSEKILAELSSISQQIKQIQLSSGEEADDGQANDNAVAVAVAVDDPSDNDQGEIYQGTGDQEIADQGAHDKENVYRAEADQGFYQWDDDPFMSYQGDAGHGNTGQGSSDQDDADRGASSVAPAYFSF